MKNKITVALPIFTLILSGIFMHAVSAQDFVPLGKLAQEYLLRATNETKEFLNTQEGGIEIKQSDVQTSQTTRNTSFESFNDVIVVNPEIVIRNSVTESIDTISKTNEQLNQEKDIIIEDIKRSVKDDIDESIIKIRRETDTQAYELQQVVDTNRAQLFENVNRVIQEVTPVENKKIQELRTIVDTSIQSIERDLRAEAPMVQIDFEKSRAAIENKLISFEEQLIQKQQLIETREGALVYLDSDQDGVSDYDEIYIYGTNPDNAFSIAGELNDGQKISQGINPLSEGSEKKNYQDPRDDVSSFVSEFYKIEKVQLIKEEDKLVFEGLALPNSFVTLYIFSTPIIVTVKTDISGKWAYELDQKLENGEHQMYVATVDATGKIVARSNPTLFVKTAEAATIGIVGSADSSVKTPNFLRDNFILITLAILITIVILAMMFVGNRRNLKTVVSELKNEINT